MTETTKTINTKEINPMTATSLLNMFCIQNDDNDTPIYINDNPCICATTSSKKQGTVDGSDINFYYRDKDKLEYIEKPSQTLDEDGYPSHQTRMVDLLSYLNIDYSDIDTTILLKPLCAHKIGGGFTPITNISGTDKITLHTIV